MWKQARSNRTIVRPTRGVRVRIYVRTRNPIAMTITDNNSCAALVCSKKRARRLPEIPVTRHVTET